VLGDADRGVGDHRVNVPRWDNCVRAPDHFCLHGAHTRRSHPETGVFAAIRLICCCAPRRKRDKRGHTHLDTAKSLQDRAKRGSVHAALVFGTPKVGFDTRSASRRRATQPPAVNSYPPASIAALMSA
jgi:hypothetical protein